MMHECKATSLKKHNDGTRVTHPVGYKNNMTFFLQTEFSTLSFTQHNHVNIECDIEVKNMTVTKMPFGYELPYRLLFTIN